MKGNCLWAIPGGHIPPQSTGREPENTSFDKVAILNMNDTEANIEVTVFFTSREPVGPYRIKVPARRVRTFRFNDLIDPEAIPLGEDYSAVVDSDAPIVVQFSRQDTGEQRKAILTTMAHPLD